MVLFLFRNTSESKGLAIARRFSPVLGVLFVLGVSGLANLRQFAGPIRRPGFDGRGFRTSRDRYIAGCPHDLETTEKQWRPFPNGP